MFTGYHFSLKDLAVGDSIRSDQAMASKFKRVKNIFDQVASDLGINYPEDDSYGYAYPTSMLPYLHHFVNFHDLNGKVYKVEAPEEQVTYGNFDCSAYITAVKLNWVSDFKAIKDLKLRNKKMDEWLYKQAHEYFAHANKRAIEAISEQFVIVEKLDIKTFVKTNYNVKLLGVDF